MIIVVILNMIMITEQVCKPWRRDGRLSDRRRSQTNNKVIAKLDLCHNDHDDPHNSHPYDPHHNDHDDQSDRGRSQTNYKVSGDFFFG